MCQRYQRLQLAKKRTKYINRVLAKKEQRLKKAGYHTKKGVFGHFKKNGTR